MKKLAGLVIILAALVLGGYYGMGVLTEKVIRKNIDVINQSNGVHAEIESYDRGWFSSEAKLNWQLHVPARVVEENGQKKSLPAQDFKMDMPLTIKHGPIIFTKNNVRFGLGYAESLFPFPKQYDEQFAESFAADSTKPQLDMSIFVNYFMKSTLDAKVPQFNLVGKDGSRFQWLGMNATSSMTSEMKKVGGTFDLDGIHFSKEDATVDLGKVTTEYDLHETMPGLYLGDANFKLPTVSVVAKGQKIFELSDLDFQSKSDIKEQLFGTSFSMSIKSISVNSKNYGPGQLDLAIRNLDADVLAKINKQASMLQNATEIQRQQIMLSLLPEIPRLFNKGAEFEISKFNFTIPEGIIDGNLFISLPKGDTASPFELLQKIHGNAKLKVPAATVKSLVQQSVAQQMAKQPDLQKTLAQQLQPNQTSPGQNDAQLNEQLAAAQADKQLSLLQQNGLITLQGTDYLIEVTLEQGKFTVNGKPFDSSMLKF